MPSQWDFLSRRKVTSAETTILQAPNKRGLRKIHFLGNGLHLVIAKICTIKNNCARVAGKWPRGKCINLKERVRRHRLFGRYQAWPPSLHFASVFYILLTEGSPQCGLLVRYHEKVSDEKEIFLPFR